MQFDVIILAIIQGIAEFLPISSSAHLIIFRDLIGIGADTITSDMALAFDIALHFGTLLAIALYFFNDFWNMVIKGITKGPKNEQGKLFWYVIVATIPAAIVGVLFEDVIEKAVRNNFILIAIALIVMGIIIYVLDRISEHTKGIKQMSYKDALIIGCSQILALMPGFSRSGTTIACARYLKIDRETAAKFSFYLSAPVVFGAVVLNLLKDETIALISSNLSVFLIGVGISFMAGLICIEFLLQYIRKNDFKAFMIYRILLGLSVIVYCIVR